MRKLTALFSGIASILFFPSLAFATTVGNPCAKTDPIFGKLCVLGTGGGGIGSVIGSVVNFMFIIAAIIALVYLVIGGIKWVTSEGDTKNVEAARNQIIAAAVGLGVTFLAYFILNLLLTFLLGHGLGDLVIPQLQ